MTAAMREHQQDPIPVTADNFIRAESDMYFSHIVQENGFEFGKVIRNVCIDRDCYSAFEAVRLQNVAYFKTVF